MLKRPFVRTLSLIVFAFGVLLGSMLIGVTVWGDLEATLFNPGMQEEAHLRQLRCPVMLTKAQQAGTIRVRFRNTLDRATRFFVRARISEGYLTLMREETTQVPLEPGERTRLDWQVSAEDAAFGRIIFFRVVVSGGYPLPARQGTCGIVVLDLPALTGNQIYALGTVLSLICTIGGGAVWIAGHPHRLGSKVQIARIIVFLTVVLTIGIVVSLLGWWVIGLATLVIILLSVGAFIGYLSQ
ncbi:MAG: hypothetical protein JXC32_16435 [Anaerolineae bacterium]|nr:hypothetical protein [Anaerolineae bacterium]